MMTTLDKNATRTSWPLRIALTVGALAVVALPLVSLTANAGAQDPVEPPATPVDEAATPVDRAAPPDWSKPEYLPLPSKNEQRLLDALERTTKLDFKDVPLAEVVAYLKDAHDGLAIQIDIRALEDLGLGTDTPMTGKVEGIPLRSALNLLLRDFDLKTIIENDVLLITTQDRADTLLLTRTYPVGDLAGEDYDSLIEAITNNVLPHTWDEVGGPASISVVPTAKGLVVSQTRDAHDEVLKLLRALRSARDLSQ